MQAALRGSWSLGLGAAASPSSLAGQPGPSGLWRCCLSVEGAGVRSGAGLLWEDRGHSPERSLA